ncbi:hypothetical protein [Streptomyces longwoodensis]|uniref:terpene synthase family protein n=1 Tax=Streptomyces longwoodensis TaxID=68231 RepID=UPI0036EFEA09
MSGARLPLVLDLPFAPQVNPNATSLAEPLLRWAREHAALPDRAVAAWRAARFDLLVGRMYPQADICLLPVIGRGVLWLFLYDDHLDPGRPGASPAYARRCAQLAARIVTDPTAQIPSDPLLRALRDVSRQLRQVGGDSWWRRYAEDLTDFLESMQHEVSTRTAHHMPDLRSYVTARRRTSGWMLLTDLVELCSGQLPDPTYRTGLHTRLREASADVACAVNDLLSLEKEVAAGEVHNQVLIRERQHSCDRRSARDATLRWMRTRLEDYVRDRDRFPDASYLNGLESLMRGSLDWSMETGRYSPRSP